MTTTPLPHDKATALITGKPAVTRAIWDALLPDLQARSFTISGVECLDTLARVRDLAASLPSGGDFDALRAQIRAEISPWLIDPNASAEDQQKQKNAANRRAELLLRLHGWQAYAQTQHALAEAHTDAFPYRQYLSSEDSRVRPAHAALNKKILPAKHPFWEKHTPPWEFNCRCDMVVMTREDVEGIKAAEKNLPPEDQKVMPPAQLKQIETQQRIVKPGGQGFLDIRTPREKNGGTGYEFNPGQNNLPLDQILDRFSPRFKTTFFTWSKSVKLANGKTLSDYFSEKKQAKGPKISPTAKPAPAPVANTRPSTLADLLKLHRLDTTDDITEDTAQQIISDLAKAQPISGITKITSLKGAQKNGLLTRQFIHDTMNEFAAFLPPHLAQKLPDIEIVIKPTLGDSLGIYNQNNKRLSLASKHLQNSARARKTIMHELTHWLHDHGGSDVEKIVKDLWDARTAGDAIIKLHPFNDRKITGKKDHWRDANDDEYAGRIYPWETTPKGTEVLTRHFEKLSSASELAKNLNHRSPDGKLWWRESFTTLLNVLHL